MLIELFLFSCNNSEIEDDKDKNKEVTRIIDVIQHYVCHEEYQQDTNHEELS